MPIVYTITALIAVQILRAIMDHWLEDLTFFTVMDSYGIELIHPIREGRSEKQVGKKGKSNHRWIVGIKLVPLVKRKL